jgi:hypothetical protein
LHIIVVDVTAPAPSHISFSNVLRLIEEPLCLHKPMLAVVWGLESFFFFNQ